jgi:hypothetical protein
VSRPPLTPTTVARQGWPLKAPHNDPSDAVRYADSWIGYETTRGGGEQRPHAPLTDPSPNKNTHPSRLLSSVVAEIIGVDPSTARRWWRGFSAAACGTPCVAGVWLEPKAAVDAAGVESTVGFVASVTIGAWPNP